jgi:hypothetical protein
MLRASKPVEEFHGRTRIGAGLRLDGHQGIHNVRRNPIEAGKNQTVEITESEPLRRFSSQHIELVAQRQVSASSETLDRKSPMTAHQISLSMSPIGGSIATSALSATIGSGVNVLFWVAGAVSA